MALSRTPDLSWPTIEARCRQICSRYFRGRPDAIEDALSTVLVRLWAKRDLVSSSAQDVPAYVARVAENVCVSQMRGSKRWDSVAPLADADLVPDAHLVHDIVERRLLLQWAMRQIDSLPERLRAPFVAHVLHGESFDMVARELGITEASARQRVAQARKRLASRIEHSGDVEASGPSVRTDRSAAAEAVSEAGLPGGSGGSAGASALGPLLDEIAARMVDTCVIQVPLPTGGTLEYHAAFEHGVGRRAQRIRTLQEYVERYPRGWRKRLELANLLLAENRALEAEAEYRAVLSRQPRVLVASMRLAQLLVLSGRSEEAVDVYRGALLHVSREATRHHLEGLIARALSGSAFPQYSAGQRSEHFHQAVEEFRAAIACEPRNLAHHHELALTFEAWGRPLDAEEAYDAALAIDPDDVYSLARCYNCLTAQGKFDKVLPRLERAVALDPGYTYAAKLLADRRANLGLVHGREGKRTLALLKRVIARNPDSADAFDAMSAFYVNRRELDASVAVLREFLGRNPHNAKGWAFLATALERNGDVRAAADAYERSHALDPGWLDVYWRGIPRLLQAGLAEKARAWTHEMLQRFPDHWDANLRAADFFLELGDAPETCLRLARRAVELQPEVEMVWRHVSALLLRLGRAEEALAAADQGIAVAERVGLVNAPWCLQLRGRALHALGREREARAAFSQLEQLARARRSFDPYYARYVGWARQELGDAEGALRCFRRAAKAGDWWARHEAARLEKRMDEARRGQAETEE